MRKRFSDLSVSKKTIVLLLILVLIPALVIGNIILDSFSKRQIANEKKLTAQKLEHASDSLRYYLETIQDIAVELGYETCINEIVQGEGAITRYTDAKEKFESILKYNDYIVKIQLLVKDEILWQYGYRTGHIFGDYGNAPFAQMVESQQEYEVWTPGHPIPILKNGTFTEDNWFSSYYHGIYDEQDLKLHGVLALHIEEDTLCSLYRNNVEDLASICWLVNKSGQVMSATEKSYFKTGLPEELQVELIADQGSSEVFYQGQKMTLFWNQCGDTGNYLVQMRELSEMQNSWILYMILVLCIFFLFCIGFLLVYNRYVLRPLRRLSGMIENTNDLNLRQEIVPVYKDEIGDLTRAYGDMIQRIDQLIQEVYVETIKTQEAEKEALLSQINPHFLYNTLDSIRWNAMMNGDREVGRQLEALSVMLRETLNFGNKYTTLEQEMSIIQNYCYLLQARFRKEIEIQIEMNPENGVWQIPKLLIQPLVENAYKHGLENKVGDKRIWIKVKRHHERLVVYVADNGVGCDAELIMRKIEENGSECFALRNVRDRIRIEYGERGKFLFFSYPGRGTLVKLFLQLELEKK